MDEIERLGALIKEARLGKGWDQTTLGTALGKDKGWVSRLESGKSTHPPDATMLRAIGRALNLTPREMLEALGYLDPEPTEPGVAYVIREDDPLADIVAMLDGASPAKLERITQLLKVLGDLLP